MDPQDKFYLHNRLTDGATRTLRAKMPHPMRTQRVLKVQGLKLQLQPARPVLVSRQQILDNLQELQTLESYGAVGCKHPTTQVWVSLQDGLPDTPGVGVVDYPLQDPEPPPRPPGAIFSPDGTSSFVPPQSWERQHPTEASEAVQKAMEEGILLRPPAPAPPDEGVEPEESEEEMPEIEVREQEPLALPSGADPFGPEGETVSEEVEPKLEPTSPEIPPPQLEVRPALPAPEVEDPFASSAPPKPVATPAQKWGKRGRNRLCPTLST